MVRSSGFGSTLCNYIALLRLAFASAPVLNTLTSLHNVTRRPVLQKVRHRTYNSSALSACKHRVSGSLSLPSRGSFHLSLTVLYSIGHQVVFSLGRWSSRLPTGFPVSCGTLDTARMIKKFRLRGCYPLWPSFPALFTYPFIITCAVRNPSCISLYQGLGSFHFAHHYFGNRLFSFFSSGYLDVSVPRVPFYMLCVHI
jgi:hypothetical protein